MSSVPKVDVSGWTDVLLLLCCQEMTRLKGLITQLNNDMEVSQVMMLRCVSAICMSTRACIAADDLSHGRDLGMCACLCLSFSVCIGDVIFYKHDANFVC